MSLVASPEPVAGLAVKAVPRVMGIVNATPDSFYADSRNSDPDAVRRLVEEGADFLDIGGESTRPGSTGVPEETELARVIPVVRAAARLRLPVSIDTSKAAVARQALEAGATILNDVTALRGDAAMATVAKRYPTVVFMHMQGTPKTMQEAPAYLDVVAEVLAFFRERLAFFEKAGGDVKRVWLDPGIGFGKQLEHNLELLRRLPELRALGRPLLVGASRKAFIGRLTAKPGAQPLPPDERLEGSLAVACRAAEAGVDVVRVHDVLATKRALEVYGMIRPG